MSPFIIFVSHKKIRFMEQTKQRGRPETKDKIVKVLIYLRQTVSLRWSKEDIRDLVYAHDNNGAKLPVGFLGDTKINCMEHKKPEKDIIVEHTIPYSPKILTKEDKLAIARAAMTSKVEPLFPVQDKPAPVLSGLPPNRAKYALRIEVILRSKYATDSDLDAWIKQVEEKIAQAEFY
jgi:hypothetical protein